MVTLMASEDACLFPVRAAAAIVRRIRKYPGSSQDSPISTVTVNGHLQKVTFTHMINALRDAVANRGLSSEALVPHDRASPLLQIRKGKVIDMRDGRLSVTNMRWVWTNS
jgi:hypothetical protein